MNVSRSASRFALLALTTLIFTNANADHGGCPCAAGTERQVDRVVPHDFAIAEPAQRAIILWNGETERLVLSTDVSLLSKENGAGFAVEFIPFPGKPSVSSDSVGVFGKLASIASKANVDLSAISPKEPLGSMSDAIDIEQIGQSTALVDLLNRRCEIQSSYIAPTIGIAERYLERGDRWFVLDKIFVADSVQSYPPISYVFPTKQLFYPLDTSTMALGDTYIDIVAITPNGISKLGELSTAIQTHSTFSISKIDLGDVSTDWSNFFDQDVLVVQHWSLQGKLSDMRTDLLGQ